MYILLVLLVLVIAKNHEQLFTHSDYYKQVQELHITTNYYGDNDLSWGYQRVDTWCLRMIALWDDFVRPSILRA